MIQATHKGALAEGIDVYVCGHEKPLIRLLSKKGADAALTGSGGPSAGHFDRLLERIRQESPDFQVGPVVEFRTPKGEGGSQRAQGITDLDFVRVARYFAKALREERLREDQKHIGRRCADLLDQFADVGVAAAIDAAAGYKAQAQDYLNRIPLLREEPGEWSLHWDLELRRALAAVYRIPHSQEHKMLPPYGQVNAVFYRCVLGDETYLELKRRNPHPSQGSNHHQFIEERYGARFRQELEVLKLLARQSGTPRELVARLLNHYRNEPLQLFLVAS